MTRPKSIIGALLACALAICAFGAASASAVPTGLTAVECEKVPVGTGTFDNAHCVTPEVAGKEYKTVEIPVNTPKAVEGKDTRFDISPHGLGNTTNPTTIFHANFGGLKVTVTCGKGNTSGGSIENKTVGEEMQISTTKAVVLWKECHASIGGKICEVKGTEPAVGANGEIKTNPISAITGPNHTVTLTPEGAKPFTKFNILAGPCLAVTTLVTVTGQAMGTADTTTHSHLTIKEPWECGGVEQPACEKLKANNAPAAQTQTVTGFTKGDETKTVGATTVPEEQ